MSAPPSPRLNPQNSPHPDPQGSPPAAPHGDGPLKNTGPTPVDTPPDFNSCCGCSSCGGGGGGANKELIQDAPGYSGENAPGRFSQGPVRYFDGVVELMTTDLTSSGFGVQWGVTRSWTNGAGYASTSFYGAGEVVSQLPYLLSLNSGNTVSVISNGVNAREFDANGGNWVPHFYIQDKLTYSSSAKQYTLTDTTGNQITFSDFSTSYPANQQGQFVSLTDPDGNVIQVTSRTSDGKPAEVQRSVTVGSTTTTESYLYTYVGSGTNAGLMQNVTLRRQVNGGSWTTIRQVAYTYYDGVLAHGNANDLRTAAIEDGSGNVLDTKYYRYYVTESGGYQHGLKYVFNADSYARLVAALGTSIDTLTDTQVAPYADNYFEYDSSKRVTKEIVQGLGCSSCSGGQGTYLFAYSSSSFTSDYNHWKYKTVETLPDNNQNIVYANYAGEVMLKVFSDVTSGLKWETFMKYDGAGRVILTALPSALTGYDDTKADLLNFQNGSYQYMSSNSGLIQVIDYATTTTATSSAPGNVAGYYQDNKIQQGQSGALILQNSVQYFSQTAGGITIYPLANSTVYRNTDGTGPETTSYTSTFFSGTNQIQSIAISLPVISSTQNGPGTADVQTTFYDVYARPIWTKDGDGFINYDPATGAVTKTITDVDTTKTGDFQNLPPGWSTPSGGGLHLIWSYVVDGLGRPTQLTDANGNITYIIYIDTNYEIRVYPGWNTQTLTPTGPTQDLRYDRPGSYFEALAMSATPAVNGNNQPTGGEAISNLQTLFRRYISAGGQLARRDDYFNLTGVTYSVSPYIGTQNTNYYTTLYGYDDRGRPNRTQTPNGTIYRTVYDGLGRVVSTWVGTNDSVSGEWSPSNNGPPSNMIQVSGSVYDTGTAPAAPTLSQTSGGTLPATTYYVKVAYVFNGPAGPGSAESSLAVSANKLLQVSSPTSVAGATGYNVYAATASGNEVLQNTSPVALGTNWTEPTTGLVSGTVAPFSNGVGDSDLTQVTQYPGGSAANRVSQYFFDWRDRLVASKSGVQSSEDNTTHRPIFYRTLDNLGELTAIDQYDGDGITITSSSGVPNPPSASLLRAHTKYIYDDQGRDYLHQVFSVDQSAGTISSNSLNVNTWYDHRSEIIATALAGGLVMKTSYDGAGRATKYYKTDGAAPTLSQTSGGTIPATTYYVKVAYVFNGPAGPGSAESSLAVSANHLLQVSSPAGMPGATGYNVYAATASGNEVLQNTTPIALGTNWTEPTTGLVTGTAAPNNSWSAAGSVASDNVLTETITSYDSDGNTILVTTKDRFHNETTTGELGDPNTTPLARDSYVASYYDGANRLTASVDVGTNGGTAYTRPASPPSRSDTVLVTGNDAFTPAGWVDTATDPRGIQTKYFYDNLGRVTKTIQDYGNQPSNANKTTEFTYDGNNNRLTIQADMPGGAHQTTQFVFGVTVTGGSNVYSNDILAATQYPDPTTGNPSSSQQVSYTVNALGQNLTMTDRDGNVHSYSYDVLGRLTADAVTTLGSGVDGTIRRIETAYDTGDRPYLYTSYNAASGGSVVNQVQDAYNGLGQLTEEWQSHSGAVNTSTTPNVQYSYTLMSGGVNNSRLTSMTYPNGRLLNFNYATGVDNTISRLTSISDSTGTLESESYLGLNTIVIRSQPQPGTELTYAKLNGESNGDGGDQYTGLDRFGRVVDQRWIITSTGTATVRTQYGYDRDGNVLYSNNLVNSNFSELYHANGTGNGYDSLNQLTNFARGVLNSTNDTISSPTHSQSWAFDALGNWTTFTSDSTTQTRTANRQNEITSISGQTSPTYDANGNMTGDQSGHTLIFDAWNRLIQVKNGSTALETYGYDGLNRRITENPGTVRDLYYDTSWQLLEEDVSGSMQDQYVWSPVYIDALIERDTPAQRFYVQQDANFNVTALVDSSGNVQERYIYDPYGTTTILTPIWSTRATSSFGWVFLHQGGRFDNATGLYLFRIRDLSPTLGRWIENDPLQYAAGSSNFYEDVMNDPVARLDPTGTICGGRLIAYAIFCANVCATAAANPAWTAAGGGVFCKNGIKCACIFEITIPDGTVYKPGECWTLDQCGYAHERGHFGSHDCPDGVGVKPGQWKPGLTPANKNDEECKLRWNEVKCLFKALWELSRTNKNGCNDKCIKMGNAFMAWESRWVGENCKGLIKGPGDLFRRN
jgi:RHS repeat-associated protein